jgi:hypothetical protein
MRCTTWPLSNSPRPAACALAVAAIASQLALGQANPTPPGGLESEWSIQKVLAALQADGRRLKPLVNQADPTKWRYSDSNNSYIAQWQTAQKEIDYLNGATESLGKQPEKLSLAMEAYFRLQAMEATISSLADGLRTHSNPAVADLLKSALSENSVNNERLKQYLMELANQKEQEYQIMDKEAQRCRAMLTKQPSSSDRSNRSRD